MNNHIRTRNQIANRQMRRGSAAVEAAIILPILVLITLMAVDISQYINVSQSITNASREGARVASRNATDDVAEVHSAVRDYFSRLYPDMTTEELDVALQVQVQNTEQVNITDLATIRSGQPISVVVSFDFRKVRWLGGLQYWSGDSNQKTSYCRRE